MTRFTGKTFTRLMAYAGLLIGLSSWAGSGRATPGGEVCVRNPTSLVVLNCSAGASQGLAFYSACWTASCVLGANHISGPGWVTAKWRIANFPVTGLNHSVADAGQNDQSTIRNSIAIGSGLLVDICCQADDGVVPL